MLYCVSDLHLGDGGPRDNFAVRGRLSQFYDFLDYVEGAKGQLIIVGDLFEFWQANVSRVIMHNLPLLERLRRMGARYVLGNHDADLIAFCGTSLLGHPFFDLMTPEGFMTVAGRQFRFVHGHQADPYCASDTPGKGRISAIYSGLWEDRNGSPWLNEYQTVEEATVGRMERVVSFVSRLLGRGDRFKAINLRLRELYPDVTLVTGHTHRAGHCGCWLYNTGTWAERVNSFVRVKSNGSVGVYDWQDGAVLNTTELPH